MKTSFSLLLPAGLIFAWSAPWACQTYAEPDGGTGVINPNQDGGNGGRFVADSGATTTAPNPDAGLTGIVAADGGGITVGAAALFASDFVYASNYADGTISRVVIPPDAGIPPYEQARYAAVIPVNNHQNNVSYPWTGQCGNQLGSNGANSPSRTVVDRKGNVAVALRAPGCQAGITRIINVGDHLSDCHIRCPNRNGLQPNQSFTQGVPLTTTAGATIELLPSNPPFTIPGAIVTPGQPVIQPGTVAAATYSCPGHVSTDRTDPVNYDDCIDFTVALGDPYPDPDADPPRASNGNQPLTHGTSFGRAAAISPNCAPNTNECDAWLGMWYGAAWVHLANGATPPLKLYDVQAVDATGVGGIYGGTVDCAGILWGTFGECNTSVLSAVTTVALNDPQYGINVPADTVITTVDTAEYGVHSGVPNWSNCGGYGISSDTAERIWVAGCPNQLTCSFNAGTYLTAYAYFLDAGLNAVESTFEDTFSHAWQSYNWGAVGMGGEGRGINVDKYNNVYQGFDSQNAAAASLNPDPDAGTYTAIPCTVSNGGTCVDRNGNPTPLGGVLNWKHVEPSSNHGQNTIGVDLDANGNLWLGQYSAGSAGAGTAVQLNGQNGAFMASVPVGSGLYSYSDFTGYALREITLSSATYEQSITGCGVSPELTEWTALSLQAALPSGTDMRLAVSVTNADDATTLANATTYTICPSLASGSCTTLDASGNGVISLAPFNLPQGAFLNVFATLVPRICSIGGGGTAQAKPVLYNVGSSQICPGD